MMSFRRGVLFHDTVELVRIYKSSPKRATGSPFSERQCLRSAVSYVPLA